ncbi:hypothetical protein D1007_01303 [Hordeum vulgare]|nr:hypothetical protein D1007_01303 [Hordeum vulgare]
MSRATTKKASSRGAWEGSIVGEDHIEYLRHRRVLPPTELVVARILGGEGYPAPQAGDVMVFAEHFARGFGLPLSDFFSGFLVQFGLQPHHLTANAIRQLAAYFTLCEDSRIRAPCGSVAPAVFLQAAVGAGRDCR